MAVTSCPSASRPRMSLTTKVSLRTGKLATIYPIFIPDPLRSAAAPVLHEAHGHRICQFLPAHQFPLHEGLKRLKIPARLRQVAQQSPQRIRPAQPRPAHRETRDPALEFLPGIIVAVEADGRLDLHRPVSA